MAFDFDTKLGDVRALVEANRRIAIHASLEDIFREAMETKPKTIVELGVSKEALANKVLAMVAEAFDADFYSCDKEDFRHVCAYPKWRFFLSDDIDFADGYFGSRIDLLFIDTDELFDHVREEIRAWFPKLAAGASVMFRCTNLAKILYYADKSSTCLGWNNDRGVIRALGFELGIRFDETKPYEGTQGGWRIKHWPWGGGLTVLRNGKP
jgi:hypothetical protein